MIEEKGAKLEFLPPYSPDYNPIEYSFSVLKRQLKNKDYLSNIIEGDDAAFADAVLHTMRLTSLSKCRGGYHSPEALSKLLETPFQ